MSKDDKTKKMKKMASVTGWLKKGTPANFEFMRDPNRSEFQRLSEEYDAIIEEYKRLKSYVEHLEREYNEGRILDIFRRYTKMKGMIKRTCMHLKVADIAGGDSVPPPTNSGPGLGGIGGVGGLLQGTRDYAKKAEQSRKREEKLQNRTSEEVLAENRKLEDGIKDLRRRISLITDLIRNLESQYAESKHYFPVRRYQMMKIMVKNITHNHLIRDNV